MIGLETARRLLDFGARIGPGPRVEEQLEGAVAIHNMLKRSRVAYLADEVGMGKTYVALGALALFRHFQPDFKVLIIAPRENIQRKWMKEMSNFAKHNVRFADFRNRTIDGQPGRPMVKCDNLAALVHEVAIDPHRDFFARMSSFSLGLSDAADRSRWKTMQNRLLRDVPWLNRSALSIKTRKEEFKDNIARAVCCALPVFDLLIIDEGHNLKHGLGDRVAARNRVLATVLGHPRGAGPRRDFPHYGPRAKRVLFLSATPLEESYRQIWNQLDVVDKGNEFKELCQEDLNDDDKKQLAAKFLIRRVTSLKVAGTVLTKNQYRREWRSGGVRLHDDPIVVSDPRQRLIVALVQKKVAELLRSEKFKMSFQIGMLASFESFLETSRLKRGDPDADGNFDDSAQTDDLMEKEGIDVHALNRLSRHYRSTFGAEMPHPKMDAVIEVLKDSWLSGRKSLVFVRRVASVMELKRKLDQCYDEWLIPSLRERLPQTTHARFDRVVRQYRDEKRISEEARCARETKFPHDDEDWEDGIPQDDQGGNDTFFAWFFRGKGPKGVISGANIQRRFIQQATTLATFFGDNYAAELLRVEPGAVTTALASHLGFSPQDLLDRIRTKAAPYLKRTRKPPPRPARIEAAQAAAMELLKDSGGALARQADTILRERFDSSRAQPCVTEAPEFTDELEVATFFTEIRRPEWQELRRCLWPEANSGNPIERFRSTELRAQLLSTAARLGHSIIDLYVLTISRLESIELRSLEQDTAAEAGSRDTQTISSYLAMLDRQMRTPLAERPWGAFDELSEIAANFDLIIDVNAHDAPTTPLAETARLFGSQLRQQQPVAGMSGEINRTVVQQFRMLGYPFVLVSTDLLQEGEDLHTFCSNIFHYGISWTPSSMEQRIGRIDRVRSLTDRSLSQCDGVPTGPDLLQVYYPYLADTVEILQVNRVLERMNRFLRLMHEGLANSLKVPKTIQVDQELLAGRRRVEAITETLKTAFPVPSWALKARTRPLAVDDSAATRAIARFHGLLKSVDMGSTLDWETNPGDGRLLGTMTLRNGRIQPFMLLLQSTSQGRLMVRCISPVGRVGIEDQISEVAERVAGHSGRIGVILTEDEMSYDLTVEDDVQLGAESQDAMRVELLFKRVLAFADRLEHYHFGKVDHPMRIFEADLRKEDGHGRG